MSDEQDITHEEKLAEPFAFSPEYDGSLSLKSAVLQALGAASMCWDTLDNAGVFHAERAIEIGDTLIEFITDTQAQKAQEASTP